MKAPALAIMFGKLKAKHGGDTKGDGDESATDVASGYARAALDAIKDDDADAFEAAVKGLARDCEEDEDDTDTED